VVKLCAFQAPGDTLDRYQETPTGEMVTKLHASKDGVVVKLTEQGSQTWLQSRFRWRDTSVWRLGRGYYVGLDMASAVHPQPYCVTKNGRETDARTRRAVRLATPVKYGIKNIKRIGTVLFKIPVPPTLAETRL